MANKRCFEYLDEWQGIYPDLIDFNVNSDGVEIQSRLYSMQIVREGKDYHLVKLAKKLLDMGAGVVSLYTIDGYLMKDFTS